MIKTNPQQNISIQKDEVPNTIYKNIWKLLATHIGNILTKKKIYKSCLDGFFEQSIVLGCIEITLHSRVNSI